MEHNPFLLLIFPAVEKVDYGDIQMDNLLPAGFGILVLLLFYCQHRFYAVTSTLDLPLNIFHMVFNVKLYFVTMCTVVTSFYFYPFVLDDYNHVCVYIHQNVFR